MLAPARIPFTSATTLALALASLTLAGCPGDDGSAEGGSSGGSTAADSSTGTPDPDTTAAPDSTGPDPSTSTGPEPTTTGMDTTTGPPPSDGLCYGLDSVGNIGTVFSLEGGAPPDLTCDATPMPCGGDPVGVWNLEDSCGYEMIPNPLEAMCPGSTFAINIISQTGTYEFVGDGTLLTNIQSETEVVLTLDPMMCFGIDCATFEGFVQMDDPMATCSAMGPNCECIVPQMGNDMGMGTYTVMGTDLLIEADGQSQVVPFCVGDDRLDVWNPIYGEPVETATLCGDDADCYDALGAKHDAYFCAIDEG